MATASEQFDPKVTTPIADYDFSVIGADGATFDPVTPAGRACYGPPRLIQNMRIGPGYEYEGWMVLDVPVDERLPGLRTGRRRAGPVGVAVLTVRPAR